MSETTTVILAAVALLAILLWILVRRSRSGSGEMALSYDLSAGERFPHRWGYTDTRFEFADPRTVRVTGSRYPLSGTSMPDFIPFAEEVLGVTFRPEDAVEEIRDKVVAEPRRNQGFLDAIGQRLSQDQISLDDQDRLVHSHGQLSVDEIYRLLYDSPLERTVDLVLYPQDEDEVRDIVRLAGEHDVVLVPYGGGTNVSGALTLPPAEQRAIASIDMQRMDRILWVDEENLQACIQAGICGREMEKELLARGYTAGHDPDSVELSTLGGWIATNASGMKKNKYGNIEEIVIEACLVTPAGDIEVRHATPRNSTGVQPKSLLFGSEGSLGIITRATLKLHPRPECQEYGSLVFPNFERGVAFLKELRQRQGVVPASIRLLNNFEFRFGQALKPRPAFWKGIVQKFQKFFLLKILGFKPLEVVGCTALMEGTRDEVAHQKKVVFRTAKKFGAVSGGASNGRRGYMLTFAIAYIRDFFNQFSTIGETFETTVPWDKIHQVIQAARQELADQCQAHGVAGTPYLAYRVTQTYQTGVCVYFTMGFCARGLENPTRVYHEIEHSIRQQILDNGGSLSHHHGIGKIRQGFLPQIQTQTSIDVLRKTKEAMDPGNIFAIGNGPFGP